MGLILLYLYSLHFTHVPRHHFCLSPSFDVRSLGDIGLTVRKRLRITEFEVQSSTKDSACLIRL